MQEAALHPDQVTRRRANVQVVRTMTDVASEMGALYRDILAVRAGQIAKANPGKLA